MKSFFFKFFFTLFCLPVFLTACSPGDRGPAKPIPSPQEMSSMADTLEASLFTFLVDAWYPRVIDTLNGGYISSWNYDWSLSAGPQAKSLVQQARHSWATSFIYEFYPDKKEFLDYSSRGVLFMCEKMWDKEFGGFVYSCLEDGASDPETSSEKRVYGQSFALYGLAEYYRMSHDTLALNCLQRAFMWMEENAHDPVYGGYFEFLKRDGTVMKYGESNGSKFGDSKVCGLKDYNSSIHLMEALTEVYRAWPDSLVKERMEEMFYLVRDTFVHPDGYLQLYFYPDWTLVPGDSLVKHSPGNYYYTPHISPGHDVETAFLLLETARLMGIEGDAKTNNIAKKLVDHSLATGWDAEKGGFFDACKQQEGEIIIVDPNKAWWAQAEGMNALLMMHLLYPGDEQDYYGKFTEMWNYIDTWLIDKKYGEWYNYGLDSNPQNKMQNKSHPWKTSYHNTRAMVNCIRMLRNEQEF